MIPEYSKITPKHVEDAALIFVLINNVHYVGVKNVVLCDEVQFVNILQTNKVAILPSEELLCLLNWLFVIYFSVVFDLITVSL